MSYHCERQSTLTALVGRGLVAFCLWVPLGIRAAEDAVRLPEVPAAYTVYHWTSANGLPASTIQCLLQTRDGYLWVGTRKGLLRFNGTGFKQLADLNCLCLAEDSAGTLWAGGAAELVAWDGAELTTFRHSRQNAPGKTDRVPRQVRALCASHDGGVWVGWEGELWRARGRELWCVHPELTTPVATALVEDRSGSLYLASHEGAVRLHVPPAPTTAKVEPLRWLVDGRCIALAQDGTLFAGGVDRVSVDGSERVMGRLVISKAGQVGDLTGDAGIVRSLAIGPEGKLWAGCEFGLCEERGHHLVRTQAPEGSQFGSVNALTCDREGNLWVGTDSSGLFCLRRQPFFAYTVTNGLASDDVRSVFPARDGRLWAATQRGANCLGKNGFETFRAAGRNGTRAFELDDLHFVAEDPDGTVWTGWTGGALRVVGTEMVESQGETNLLSGPLTSAYADGEGRFWVLGDHYRVFTLQNRAWTHQTISGPGLAGLELLGIVEAARGDVWLGSYRHGLFRLHDGSRTRLTSGDGLASDLVAPVKADPDGTLWVASDKGLLRLRLGHITRYTTDEGLAENLVLSLVEDDLGWFWLNGHQGIHRVRRQDLNDLAEGKAKSLNCVTYGVEDGLLSSEGNGGTLPNSCRTTDGRIWFPTTKGLAVVDPRLAQRDELPPGVLIESVEAGGEVVFENLPHGQTLPPPIAPPEDGPVTAAPAGGRPAGAPMARSSTGRPPALRIPGELRLRPGRAESLVFHLTANTFPRSDRVRFRYRFTGRGPQWTDLGNQPTLLLPALPAGHYRLQVTACNAHGVWNPLGTEFAFYLTPFFYQTWTFYALCGGGAVLLLAGFETYRHSVQRTIHGLEQEAALTRERVRIARDLHDDLGASLSRIALLSAVAEKELAAEPAALSAIGRVSLLARQVVDSLSESVWATNPKYDDLASLAAYFREYAARHFEVGPTRCRLSFPPDLPRRPLGAEFRRELFLVLKESLQNVSKHASASLVEISLVVECDWLELVVQDDGQGLPAAVGPGRHHGLENMRARVAALTGLFRLESAPVKGTRLSIRVPLPPSRRKMFI